MKVKKNKKIRGFIREDAKGHYITNGKTPFEDGKKIFRLTDDLNGFLRDTIKEENNVYSGLLVYLKYTL